jgi:cytoskeletal protein RodZ
MSFDLSSNKSSLSSTKASYKEIGLIFLGVIIVILILCLIVHFFTKKNNKKQPTLSTASVTNSSNFAKLNYDRQMEELKKQTENSSLNTPYITSSNNI